MAKVGAKWKKIPIKRHKSITKGHNLVKMAKTENPYLSAHN